MKKLLFAVLAVLIASPAFAAVQNVKVSGDIQTTYVNRQDFSLGFVGGSSETPQGLVSQSGFAEQTRLRIDADLTDNVSTTVRLINETAWGLDSNESGLKGVDLDLAYVTLREFLYSPLTVSVGRQEFIFGNGLIMGGGPNNSTNGHFATVAGDLTEIDSQDGIKAVLDYKPLTLTMIYIKNTETVRALEGLYGKEKENSDVYGLNANYQLGDAYNTVVEGYLFGRVDQSGLSAHYAANGTEDFGGYSKGDTLYVPGLRVSTNPIKGLNVQGEVAWQGGNHVVDTSSGSQEAEHRNAMAAQLMATYSLPVLEKYKPAVNASYTFVSGDKNGSANANTSNAKSAKVYTAWDPMFESQGAGTIYNTLFNLTNMNIIALGASISPLQDVTAAFTWSDLFAAQRYGEYNSLEILQPNGTSIYATPNTTDAYKKTALGNEYDVNFGYAYTEDVSFGLNLGWFAPGDFAKSVATKTASQAIADVRVSF
jgi:hypothetical protein